LNRYGRRKQGIKIITTLRKVIMTTGVLSLLVIGIAFTGNERIAVKWLSSVDYKSDCDFIVLLPAGPIPNPTMLTRIVVASREFKKNPQAKIIISLVADPPLESSSIWEIRDELILRGVVKENIFLEIKARNTAEHAKYVKETRLIDPIKHSFLIVTSPLHMRRSVMAFKAVGFSHIYGTTGLKAPPKENLGWGQFFRYDIWNALHTEIGIMREIVAIIYYKVTGKA